MILAIRRRAVERYIDGREFNIGVVAIPEERVLPLAEIEFQVGPESRGWPIVTYDGKWDVEGTEDRATPVRCPAMSNRRSAAKLPTWHFERFICSAAAIMPESICASIAPGESLSLK